MLFLLYFFSTFVVTSVGNIRISRLFLVVNLIVKIVKGKSFTTCNPKVQTFFSKLLKLLVAYLVFLTISTLISIFFIRTDDYTSTIASDLGPRIEIILIIFISSLFNYRQLKTCFLGFTFGFAVQFFQSLYTLFYNLKITSSPIFMSSFLVDQTKYDFLLPNAGQLGANRIAALSSDGFSLIRASSLVGEPSIFGIYSALCFSIFLFIPSHFSSFLLSRLSRSILVLMAFFCCVMSGSKTSLILLIVIPFLYCMKHISRLISSLRFNKYLLSLASLPLIIFIFLSVFSQNLFLSRLITGSGHLDYLFTTVNSLFSPEHISDLFVGTGSGVAASKHRFFITQMTEVGIFPGSVFCLTLFIIFYNYAISTSSLEKYYCNVNFSIPSAMTSPIFIISAQFLTSLMIYDPFNQPILWYTLLLGINTLSPGSIESRTPPSSSMQYQIN